jgi:hypothetical protein
MPTSKLLLSYVAGVCLFAFALYCVPAATATQSTEHSASLCVASQNGADSDCTLSIE